MKIIIVLFLNLIFTLCAYSQTYTDKSGNVHLWGEVSIEELKKEPYEEWYTENSKDYTSTLSSKESSLFDGVSVEVFFGTWCSDTKYLLPKFLKTWEEMGLDVDNLKLIAVHNEGDLRIKGPNNETKGKDIQMVPTFIFIKNSKEIGRIIESPTIDLDTDMIQIVKGNAH